MFTEIRCSQLACILWLHSGKNGMWICKGLGTELSHLKGKYAIFSKMQFLKFLVFKTEQSSMSNISFLSSVQGVGKHQIPRTLLLVNKTNM